MLRLPPKDIATRELPIEVVEAGVALHRIHPVGYGPVWFGPGKGKPPVYRFDDPRSEYGVCYFGFSRMAALVETMLRDLSTLVVSETNLEHRQISRVDVGRELRVVKAHSEGLFHLGATAEVGAAKLEFPGVTPEQSYEHSMAWSRALHDHRDAPDGIAYHSSHDDSLECLALFGDRAQDVLIDSRRPVKLSRLKTLLAKAVVRYGIILIPAL